MTTVTLAGVLQVTPGPPAVDRTGLNGFHRVKLQAADLMQPGISATIGPRECGRIRPASEDYLVAP